MKEKQIQHSICKLLDGYKMAKRLNYIRLNSGMIYGGEYTSKRTGITRKRFIKLAPIGTADVVIFFENLPLRTGTVFFEFKREGGYQTEAQVRFMKFMQGLGYAYFVIDSVEEGMKIIERYLYPPKGVQNDH